METTDASNNSDLSLWSSLARVIGLKLYGLGGRLQNLARRIYTPPEQRRVIPWFRDNGDKTLRLFYDLDASSVVVDLGGYEGQWSSDIFAMYGCTIHILEPVPEFAKRIESRFAKNPKIKVYAVGLASQTQQIRMTVNQDGSSVFRTGGETCTVTLVDAIDFLQSQTLTQIDLIKVNIEGGEYDLLERLIETGYITRIRDIQVQFHADLPAARARMEAAQQALSKTHYPTYQYPFVWENWRLRP